MDLDGDGMLSMYELEYFYEEQCERMESMGIEPLPFHDLLCQMLDLVKPECDGKANVYNNGSSTAADRYSVKYYLISMLLFKNYCIVCLITCIKDIANKNLKQQNITM